MKAYDIWAEGYRATGNVGHATYFGTVTADNFKTACALFADAHPDFAKYYDAEHNTFWGCRLFDNEADARKSYG